MSGSGPKFTTPCAEAAKASLKCQEENPQDKATACKELMDIYKECKQQWMEQLRRDKLEKYRRHRSGED
jgi:cytochrome c oxidase assembly protein subunit 23